MPEVLLEPLNRAKARGIDTVPLGGKVTGKDGRARDARRRGRKPRPYYWLDEETKAILGDHDIIWKRSQMEELHKLFPHQRPAVVRLILDGKAKNTRDAKAILYPPKPYDVQDDVRQLRALRDRLAPHWTTAEDRAVIRDTLLQFAREVEQGNAPGIACQPVNSEPNEPSPQGQGQSSQEPAKGE
jgi:hypothetical protein